MERGVTVAENEEGGPRSSIASDGPTRHFPANAQRHTARDFGVIWNDEDEEDDEEQDKAVFAFNEPIRSMPPAVVVAPPLTPVAIVAPSIPHHSAIVISPPPNNTTEIDPEVKQVFGW